MSNKLWTILNVIIYALSAAALAVVVTTMVGCTGAISTSTPDTLTVFVSDDGEIDYGSLDPNILSNREEFEKSILENP